MEAIGKTSSTVKNRWNKENYKQYRINLRKEDDAIYINYIEQQKKGGKGITEIVKESIDKSLED